MMPQGIFKAMAAARHHAPCAGHVSAFQHNRNHVTLILDEEKITDLI
jgi:hypothetical protein